jgi:hypothetical protein
MWAMARLDAREVDPRDPRWEVWDPAYRVYFWRQLPEGGWSARVLEVADTDTTSTLGWADVEAQNVETFQVFAVVPRDGEIGLVRPGHPSP